MIGFYETLSGAVLFGTWVAGVLFFRFWSKTQDRLFLIFGVAFWIMALERMILMFMRDPGRGEDHSLVYVIRLIAFLLIIFAIVDKNREDRKAL